MKTIILISAIAAIAAAVFVACGSDKLTCVGYNPKDKNTKKTYTLSDSSTHQMRTECQLRNKKNRAAMPFRILYTSKVKDLKNLVSLQLKLYAKDPATGEFTKEIAATKHYTQQEWHTREQYENDNFTQPLSELFIDTSSMAARHPNFNDSFVSFIVVYEFPLSEYYPALKEVVLIKTTETEREFSQELELFETGACTDKIRSNPFG